MGARTISLLVEVISALGVIGALVFSGIQIRRSVREERIRDAERRRDAALDLQRMMLIEGAAAEAVRRMSGRLRAVGIERYSVPTWYLIHDADLQPKGLLDPSLEGRETAFSDYYRILAFYQRCDLALRDQLVDAETLFELIGFNLWWWSQAFRSVTSAEALRSVQEVGGKAWAWAVAQRRDQAWRARCVTDFNAGPAS